MLYSSLMDSPVGQLTLVANECALLAVLWEDDAPGRVALDEATPSSRQPVLLETQAQLEEYFGGRRRIFELPTEPRGTDFQKSVWQALTKIPFGATRSYGELAKSIGAPKASRAVGAANGKNPLSIVVPCHRVIGASGKLTGFAGGLEMKARLLAIEQH